MGKLFIVPTPIGNLKDMTLRAIEVLKDVELILAEDTRTSGKLLQHFSIDTPMLSYHMHNEHKKLPELIQRLQAGETMGLISDAGTPSISDPGFLLSRACVENDIEIECLPGATAFVPALVMSGLPSDRFVFEGFLPPKKGRQSRIMQLSEEQRTIILYESPHKIVKTLSQVSEHFGTDRRASVSREISKLHEETVRGSLAEILEYFSNRAVKGEFVLVIEGKK